MNCTTCKFDQGHSICLQGHTRWPIWSMENCHAYKEKEKCECQKYIESHFIDKDVSACFELICRKCRRKL